MNIKKISKIVKKTLIDYIKEMAPDLYSPEVSFNNGNLEIQRTKRQESAASDYGSGYTFEERKILVHSQQFPPELFCGTEEAAVTWLFKQYLPNVKFKR